LIENETNASLSFSLPILLLSPLFIPPPYTRPMPLLAISAPSSTAACLYSGDVPADDPQKTAMRRNGRGAAAEQAEAVAGVAGIAFRFFFLEDDADWSRTLVL
jgi:hypothetical protein